MKLAIYLPIYPRVISPTGLVTQFALTLELEVIQNIGWLLSGMYKLSFFHYIKLGVFIDPLYV